MEDLVAGEFLSGDLVVHRVKFYGVDLFVLARAPHGSDADQVKVLDLLFFLCSVQESIHDLNRPEERVLVHLVRRQHLDHPIDHFRPELGRDLVARKELFRVVGLIAEMVEDQLRVVFASLLGILFLEVDGLRGVF